MQKNVTKNELQMQVDLLNKITGNPLEMWKRNDKGEYLRDESDSSKKQKQAHGIDQPYHHRLGTGQRGQAE